MSPKKSALTTYEEAKNWAYANNALAEASYIMGAMLELLHERDTPEQVASLLVEQQDVLYQLEIESGERQAMELLAMAK